MNEMNYSENFKKLLALKNEELNSIFSELSLNEIEDLLSKLEEVSKND